MMPIENGPGACEVSACTCAVQRAGVGFTERHGVHGKARKRRQRAERDFAVSGCA